jgi:16S rRNA processing protein RimM
MSSHPRAGVASGYDPEMLSIGVLGRPHGVAGEILFRPHDPSSDAMATLSRVIVVKDGRARPFDVAAARPADKGWIVRLAGVDDRDAAAALTLADVQVRRADLPPLEPGEYYVEDVVGCAVDDEAGRALGTVQGLFWNGAHDVATVVDAAGVERLIPIVSDFVLAVDAAGRKVRVRWSDE